MKTIQQDLSDEATTTELGLYVLWSSIDELRGKVVLGVLAVEPGSVEAIDARYGPGVVELDGALEPVG